MLTRTCLAVATAATLAVVVPVAGQTTVPPSTTSTVLATSTTTSSTTTPALGEAPKATTPRFDAGARDASAPIDPRGDWWLVVFTGLSVLVAALQGVILLFTLQSTRTAANAAKASADHVKATDRPWLFMGSDGAPDGWPREGIADLDETPDRIRLKWSLTNHGNTPAWVVSMDLRFEVRPWPLPDAPPEEEPQPAYDLPVTARRPHSLVTPDVPVSDVEWHHIIEGNLCAAFCGTVRYRDAFGDQHVTRFCETWHWIPVRTANPDGSITLHRVDHEFRPVGPTPAWTTHT